MSELRSRDRFGADNALSHEGPKNKTNIPFAENVGLGGCGDPQPPRPTFIGSRHVSLVARHLEANGIPTVVIATARDIVESAAVPRLLFVDFPLGAP
jgi:hypothetical protein